MFGIFSDTVIIDPLFCLLLLDSLETILEVDYVFVLIQFFLLREVLDVVHLQFILNVQFIVNL